MKSKSVFLWDFNVKPKLTAWKQMCDHARNKCVQHSFQSKSYYLGLKLIFLYAWLSWWTGILPENVQNIFPNYMNYLKLKILYLPSIHKPIFAGNLCMYWNIFKVSVKTVKGMWETNVMLHRAAELMALTIWHYWCFVPLHSVYHKPIKKHHHKIFLFFHCTAF